MRGNQRTDRTAKVLSKKDHKTIIDELRRFSPLYLIAAKLNVSRHTLEKYVHSVPELQQELDDRDEGMVDLTQRSLFDAAIGNIQRDSQGREKSINVNAATFLLERMGKKRGFSQHVEVEHAEVPTFTYSRRDSTIIPET